MSKPAVKTRHRTGAAETINPDHIGMHRLIVAGVIVTLLAAIATSWNGLEFIASLQLLPVPLHWLTPVMIDVPLVVLTLARGALKKRGIRTRGLLFGIFGLTFYSSVANFAHTMHDADLSDPGVWMGALTNALAPWLILSLTEVLWLVVTRPIKPRVTPKGKAKPKRTPRAPRVTASPTAQPALFPPGYDSVAVMREANS